MTTAMKKTAWTLAILASLAGQAFGQDTSSIIGTAKDQSGAALPGATVTVADAARGVTQTGQSSPEGSFVFPQLPAGTYTVTVENDGNLTLDNVVVTDPQCTPAFQTGGTQSLSVSNPMAGVWEVAVEVSRTSAAGPATFDITGSVLCVDVSP